MQILVKQNQVIDYCENGYISMGTSIVCPHKNKTFLDCTIVTVDGLPADINDVRYLYENGQFIKDNTIGKVWGSTGYGSIPTTLWKEDTLEEVLYETGIAITAPTAKTVARGSFEHLLDTENYPMENFKLLLSTAVNGNFTEYTPVTENTLEDRRGLFFLSTTVSQSVQIMIYSNRITIYDRTGTSYYIEQFKVKGLTPIYIADYYTNKLTTNTRIRLRMEESSLAEALECGFNFVGDVYDGFIRFYSVQVPSMDIGGQYEAIQSTAKYKHFIIDNLESESLLTEKANVADLGNCAVEDIIPITKGGTGAANVASARNNLGLGNTADALPMSNGGTGANNAADARDNLLAGSGVVTQTLLWENASPNSGFALQTIPLDLDGYDYFKIIAVSGDVYYTVEMHGGNTVISQPPYAHNAASYFITRIMQRVDGGIEIRNCYLKNALSGSAGSLYNNYIIPFKIYGIKIL